jgi:hypothetical protein
MLHIFMKDLEDSHPSTYQEVNERKKFGLSHTYSNVQQKQQEALETLLETV